MARRPGELVLAMRQLFHASAEFLFDAWTDPALLARWFHARPRWTTEVVCCDLRVGGAWEIIMHPDDGSADCRVFGEYLTIRRPERLVLTWYANEDRGYRTVVDLAFEAKGPDATELVLNQTGLREDADREDHERGWQGCLASLERLVDGPSEKQAGDANERSA
jgi:uncharacterized protein YndB with AHSA1/START domain